MWQDKSGAGRCCNLKPPICAKHSYYKQITSLNTHLLLEIKSWRLYLAILAGDQVACAAETAMTIPWLMEIETINPAITKWFEWIIASLLNCYKIFMSNLFHFWLNISGSQIPDGLVSHFSMDAKREIFDVLKYYQMWFKSKSKSKYNISVIHVLEECAGCCIPREVEWFAGKRGSIPQFNSTAAVFPGCISPQTCRRCVTMQHMTVTILYFISYDLLPIWSKLLFS